jgi:hypothetical protein
MSLIEQLYAAAAHVGFLQQCTWHPADGRPPVSDLVGLRAPDESLLDNLTLSIDTTISYPATIFVGLARGDEVEIDAVRFQVREVRAVGDGSELHAKLTRL